MCQYSLEGYPTRDAKDQEELELVRLTGGHQGFIGPSDPRVDGYSVMVCVKPGKEMTLPVMEFRDEVMQIRPHPSQAACAMDLCRALHGKTNVVVKMTNYIGRRGDSDALQLACGQKIPLLWFKAGMKATVGVKLRDLDKAMGLDQIRAEVPRDEVPKREPANVTRYDAYHPASLARLYRL